MWVYCHSNGRGQEYHCRQNPSEGNGGEHHWHCYRRHRLSVQEDDGEAILSIPSPLRDTFVEPPLPPSDQQSGQMRRSAPSSPSSTRHESALQPSYQLRH